jgi:hypothetical protein
MVTLPWCRIWQNWQVILDVYSLWTFCHIIHFVLTLCISFDVLYLYVLTYSTLRLFRRFAVYVLSHYTFCHYTFVEIHCVFRRFVVIRSVTEPMRILGKFNNSKKVIYVRIGQLRKVGYFRRESTKHVMKSHSMSTFSSVMYGFKSLKIIKFIKIKTSEEINNLIDT